MVVALYGIILALSLLLPAGYFLFVRPKQREPWLLVLFLAVCIVDLGYLLLSLSRSLPFALFANKVAYLGQIFVPMCMFMIISKLSGFTYKKWVTYTLIGAATLMYGLVLTTGHLDWYYKSVELTYVDGAAGLIKEYGVLHPVNLVYVLSYFVMMLAVIVMSQKKREAKSQKLVGLMLAVVIGNIGGWIVEKLVHWNFEFLSASYLMSEFVFFFVYWILQDYVHLSEVSTPKPTQDKTPIIVVNSLSKAEKIQMILKALPEDTTLSARQIDILERILDYKSRKEIASELHLSENTVKTHTGMLYRVLGVSSRDEIYMKFQ